MSWRPPIVKVSITPNDLILYALSSMLYYHYEFIIILSNELNFTVFLPI